MHSSAEYRERGATLSLQLSPRSDGRGLSVAVAPRWGTPAHGADALWRAGSDPLGGAGLRRTDAGNLDTQVGYGLAADRLPGVFTPFSEFGYGRDGQRLRLGIRYGNRGRDAGTRSFDFQFAGERTATDALMPIFRLGLRGALRF